MRFAYILVLAIEYFAFGAFAMKVDRRATGGYLQNPSGSASFTMYSGCETPACGIAASSGFTAAMDQLSFGAAPGAGAGDACGRCFAITGTEDPISPSFAGPFNSIVVKVTDLCPVANNPEFCSQTTSDPENEHGKSFHFDLCEDTGAAAAFFPTGHDALTGTFTEVSCSEWSGSDGAPQFTGACLEGESAGFWPSVGCGNKGTAPS